VIVDMWKIGRDNRSGRGMVLLARYTADFENVGNGASGIV
jgi:hypothetical protein